MLQSFARHFGISRSNSELRDRPPLVKLRQFGHSRTMDQDSAIDAFAALAHPTRLSVFKLLVQHSPDGVPALTIAERLDAKPSTLSGHLAVLKRAGLLTSTRHQREIRYAARLTSVNDLVGFLLSDCCGGKVQNCKDILTLLDTDHQSG